MCVATEDMRTPLALWSTRTRFHIPSRTRFQRHCVFPPEDRSVVFSHTMSERNFSPLESYMEAAGRVATDDRIRCLWHPFRPPFISGQRPTGSRWNAPHTTLRVMDTELHILDWRHRREGTETHPLSIHLSLTRARVGLRATFARAEGAGNPPPVPFDFSYHVR